MFHFDNLPHVFRWLCGFYPAGPCTVVAHGDPYLIDTAMYGENGDEPRLVATRQYPDNFYLRAA